MSDRTQTSQVGENPQGRCLFVCLLCPIPPGQRRALDSTTPSTRTEIEVFPMSCHGRTLGTSADPSRSNNKWKTPAAQELVGQSSGEKSCPQATVKKVKMAAVRTKKRMERRTRCHGHHLDIFVLKGMLGLKPTKQ